MKIVKMKLKNNRITSLVVALALALSLALCVHGLPTRANAATPDTPMIVGVLTNPGDTATYELQIDHALYPETVLYAFAYGKGTGNARIAVYDENDSFVAGITLQNKLDDNIASSVTFPKGGSYISSSEATTKSYRITVSTTTGDVGYAMNIGTIDTFVENFGGPNNITTVAKNAPSKAATSVKVGYFGSHQMLLNEGEWFRYTADGYTYITARIMNYDSLAFEVYDAADHALIYRTTAANRGSETVSASSYQGYVQAGLELENGKDYLIKFYSTSHIPTTDVADLYYVSIGYPVLTNYEIRTPTQTFYVPANTTKTFYINVSDSSIPVSARASTTLTNVHFTADSSMNNTYITSCSITAPNGYTFSPTNGRYSKFETPSPVNYLSDPNHVPIQGTWKVTIRTSKALNFKFYIDGYCKIIMGKDGN